MKLFESAGEMRERFANESVAYEDYVKAPYMGMVIQICHQLTRIADALEYLAQEEQGLGIRTREVYGVHAERSVS